MAEASPTGITRKASPMVSDAAHRQRPRSVTNPVRWVVHNAARWRGYKISSNRTTLTA